MVSPAKRQKTLACQRCRSRKQKCSETRPCENCMQSNKECISSDSISRKHRFSAEYTRSLQERVAELEAQSLDITQDESLNTQQSSAEESWVDGEGCNLQRNSASARAASRIYSTPQSPQQLAERPGPDPETTHNFVVPACPTTNLLPFTPLQAEKSDQQSVAGDLCGHSSLLIGILAALSSGNPCGIQTSQHGRFRDIRMSSSKAIRLNTQENSVYLSDSVSDALIQVYLQRVNPRYPFLHGDTFHEWYGAWKACRRIVPTADQTGRWKGFFVVMVQAVSILLTPQVSQGDISLSQNLYNTAITLLPLVFAHSSPVLHAQAYLLMALHALHSPSSQMIVSMVSAAMRHCAVNQLHLAESEPQVPFAAFSLEVQIRRRVFWSAYALDRLISWIYHIPNNLIDEQITVEMFSNVEDTHLYSDTGLLDQTRASDLSQRTHISPALHLIRCRCIQSRIISTMMRSDFNKIDASPTWRQHMLEELESWKIHIQRLSHRSSRGYLSDRWVGMAYNYTILLLHEPTKDNVIGNFGDRSVQASVKIMLTFRDFQKDRQTAQLWPGLLSQFNVGITFLYCFWATPLSRRPPSYSFLESSEALRACSTSLAILSERWVQAEPLRDVFDILAKEIPLHEIEPYPRHISPEASAYIESQLGWLKVVVKNRGVLRMLMEMISEDFPSSPTESLDHGNPKKSTMQGSNEHFCTEHCSLFPGTVFCDPITDMEELEGDYEAFDNSLIFPSLFGSAEF